MVNKESLNNLSVGDLAMPLDENLRNQAVFILKIVANLRRKQLNILLNGPDRLLFLEKQNNNNTDFT